MASPWALLALRANPPRFLCELAARYGDLVYFHMRGRSFYLLNHPDYLEEVFIKQSRSFVKGPTVQLTRHVMGDGLLASEGEFHLRQRRLIQPMFHRQRIEGYGQVMVDYAARLAERWQAGTCLDMDEAMRALTLSIVGKTLFGTEVEAEAAEVGQALYVLLDAFEQVNNPLLGLFLWLHLPVFKRADAARDRLHGIISRMITEHRASGDQGDLLSWLLAAEHEDSGQGMGNAQVLSEAMTLFLAGHETTANALTWTWYLLSQNPAEAAGLREELDRVLAGRPPSVEDLPRLAHTRRVVAEALRLFPPVWATGRTAQREVTLGGYRLPAGANVLMSQWVTHHDARFYPEPFAFRPDRWLPEAVASRPRLAYYPFGAGPRVCIGEQFAWMELTLVLATLAQHWRPRLAPGHRVAQRAQITLRPKGGMPMVLERR